MIRFDLGLSSTLSPLPRQRQNGTMYKNLAHDSDLKLNSQSRFGYRFVTRQRQNGTMYKNLGPPIRPPKFLYMVARQRQRVKKWRVKLLGEPARPNSQALLGRKAPER